MKEQKAIFIIDILKNMTSVYFDTFFVFYFFRLSNYEVIPLAKYYISLYLFVGIGFFLIRKRIKNNFKVPIFRIGISLHALYISLIMILKENIINYIFLVGILKGISDGFYYYPKNILDTEKISNNDRQKYNGIVNVINNIVSIAIPFILGVALTFFSYVSLGKIFFILFVVMFIISFYLKDTNYTDDKIDLKRLFKVFKHNKDVRFALVEPLLSGFTFSSGVMELIITLFKIHSFKTNFNLGIVDSICALSSLMMCALFALRINKKHFPKIMIISGIIGFSALVLFAFVPSLTFLIIYLIVRYSCITSINLISNYVVTNFTNSKEIGNSLKTEFYCIRDIFFSISRSLGCIILLLVCLIWGMDYIHYIMVLPAISILVESVVIGRLSKKC